MSSFIEKVVFFLEEDKHYDKLGKYIDSRAKELSVDNFRKYYDTYIEDIDINKSWDLKFISNNKKLLKDMLILSTKIKETYRDTWEDAIC